MHHFLTLKSQVTPFFLQISRSQTLGFICLFYSRSCIKKYILDVHGLFPWRKLMANLFLIIFGWTKEWGIQLNSMDYTCTCIKRCYAIKSWTITFPSLIWNFRHLRNITSFELQKYFIPLFMEEFLKPFMQIGFLPSNNVYMLTTLSWLFLLQIQREDDLSLQLYYTFRRYLHHCRCITKSYYNVNITLGWNQYDNSPNSILLLSLTILANYFLG